jgi:hypothetical protein
MRSLVELLALLVEMNESNEGLSRAELSFGRCGSSSQNGIQNDWKDHFTRLTDTNA